MQIFPKCGLQIKAIKLLKTEVHDAPRAYWRMRSDASKLCAFASRLAWVK